MVLKERIEIKVSELSPGMVVARSVWDQKGKLLIAVNNKVTDTMIRRLKRYNVPTVYIYIEGSESEVLKIAVKKNSFQSLIKAKNLPNNIIYKPSDYKKAEDINIYNTFYTQINTLIDKCSRELFKPEINIDAIKKPVLEALKNKEIINLLIYMRVKAQYLLIHSIEVALLCSVIGLESNIPDKRLRSLLLAALLHDIGMTQIKDEIIFKTAPLESEEIELLRTHAAISVLVLKDIAKIDREILEIIYQHHERINGSGYPGGLTENIINSSAKILSACDVYSAISHERSYRGKIHPQERIEFLFASGDHYFSYDIVKMLLDKISIYYKGQWVKLNTGHVGVISGVDPGFPTRPYIKLIYDEKGRRLPVEKEVFLGERGLVRIYIEKII
ncbi:MAG: HD-GYP domain-containing protein [Deltaproteobacteria bacterium]